MVDSSDKFHIETRREFRLDVDERLGEDFHRFNHSVKLQVHPNYSESDPNKWTVKVSGGAVGWNWSSGEKKARESFLDEINRLRATERRAQLEGRFAESWFSIGSISSDA